ncbi:class I SAM-dependent methyltransferase [uncultured Aquimarina sp.]|uniref:class I SAM-dependent DNA methyltransferase n=1 Tax=uncultured Aquimarina sp. TaxID=575652 RepID=UPI00262E9EB7|nr:class I SAM-dependent methyltransferase [uncultured Aquimarina sp.]
MNELYTNLAEVYEAMYSSFIDYKAEFEFYASILKKNDKKQVLELGSGIGHLGNFFQKNEFEYSGIDLSEGMVKIAKRKYPKCKFSKEDIRSFKLDKQVGSMLMVGRTISYLLTNKDVLSTFHNVYNNLKEKGIFSFDFIDAEKFIPSIRHRKEVFHNATYENEEYLRKSIWNIDLDKGMTFNWKSHYFKKSKDGLKEIGIDKSVIRTFTREEIRIFLELNDFKIKEIISKESYAFPTYVIVAEK